MREIAKLSQLPSSDSLLGGPAITIDRFHDWAGTLGSTAESTESSETHSMKNQVILGITLAFLLCASAFAQRVEIYGGAQFDHLQPNYNAAGWNASLTGNFKHVLGITGDFSGGYTSRRTSSTVYTYTVGPVLTARLPVVQPFVHALFGGATISGGGVSDNAFAMLVGGGLDIGLRKGIGLRLVQADWLMTQFGGQTQESQGRVSAGIVMKF